MFPLFLLLFFVTAPINAMQDREHYHSTGEYAIACEQKVHPIVMRFLESKPPYLIKVKHDAAYISYRAKLTSKELVNLSSNPVELNRYGAMRFIVSRSGSSKLSDTLCFEYEKKKDLQELFLHQEAKVEKIFIKEFFPGTIFDKYDALYKENQNNRAQ